MLSINERYRLADLESLLLRTDRQFVVRMEHIADVLLPLHGGPPPPDDVMARSGRTGIDERRVSPSASFITHRCAGMISRLARSYMTVAAIVLALVGPGEIHPGIREPSELFGFVQSSGSRRLRRHGGDHAAIGVHARVSTPISA